MTTFINVRVGAQWTARTKTYTIQDIWMHYEHGRWEAWVAVEIKWKKRQQFVHAPSWAFIARMEREGAILQDGPSVQTG